MDEKDKSTDAALFLMDAIKQYMQIVKEQEIIWHQRLEILNKIHELNSACAKGNLKLIDADREYFFIENNQVQINFEIPVHIKQSLN